MIFGEVEIESRSVPEDRRAYLIQGTLGDCYLVGYLVCLIHQVKATY